MLAHLIILTDTIHIHHKAKEVGKNLFHKWKDDQRKKGTRPRRLDVDAESFAGCS